MWQHLELAGTTTTQSNMERHGMTWHDIASHGMTRHNTPDGSMGPDRAGAWDGNRDKGTTTMVTVVTVLKVCEYI